MKQQSANLEFEKAELTRKKIDFLKNYKAKSVISNPRLSNLDVFFLVKSEERIFINYLMLQNGTIVQSKSYTAEVLLEETIEDILALAVAQIRTTFKSIAKEIILPFRISYPEEGIKITIPKAGDKKKLLELSEKNARYFIEEHINRKRLDLEEKNKDKSSILLQLKKDLKLSQLPVHIDCFDNSNLQGSYPVSAMVCFKNGIASKKDYRLFNIKTVEGINDFASMKEAVGRQYKRVIDEKLQWPQLIIIDGGKGQLSAAISALDELNSTSKTTIVGLAKNEEEIFFPGDKESLKLPLNSSSLNLIRFIRDEVHRFGINFHRKKRSKGAFKNELEDISGIGKGTTDLLLKEFRSLKNIKGKTIEEISKIIGNKKAKLVFNALKK